jgi:hypothetical protein
VTLTQDGEVLHEKGYGPREYERPDEIPPVFDLAARSCFFDLDDAYAAPSGSDRVLVTLTSGERTKTIAIASWGESDRDPVLPYRGRKSRRAPDPVAVQPAQLPHVSWIACLSVDFDLQFATHCGVLHHLA